MDTLWEFSWKDVSKGRRVPWWTSYHHAVLRKRVSPKPKKSGNEGTTCLEGELATAAESLGPEDVRAAIVFDEDDRGVMTGGLHGAEIDLDVDVAEEKGDGCAHGHVR